MRMGRRKELYSCTQNMQMSSDGLVEQTLRSILTLIDPTTNYWEVRFHIIEDDRDAVQAVESLRGIN